MRIEFWNMLAVACLAVGVIGCNSSPAPVSPPATTTTTTTRVAPGPARVEESRTRVETTPGRVDVDANDQRTDVEVGNRAGKPAVDVDVVPGEGVKVDIDRDKIRDRIEERREEREIERAK